MLPGPQARRCLKPPEAALSVNADLTMPPIFFPFHPLQGGPGEIIPPGGASGQRPYMLFPFPYAGGA